MREPRILSPEEIEAWMRRQQWIYAKTMPRHPHHYSLKRLQDPRRFEDVVLTIWERGYDRKYLNRLWRSLAVGNLHYIWVHTEPGPGVGVPIGQTVLVNRAQRAQERLL
jgi:hypothetical protein